MKLTFTKRGFQEIILGIKLIAFIGLTSYYASVYIVIISKKTI